MMRKNVMNYAIITVLDNLSETSMPWNEFVLYRHKFSPEIKQYVVVCDLKSKQCNYPNNLDIEFTGFETSKIRKAMKRIVNDCRKNEYNFVIHLHQNKSALIFNLSTIFRGYTKKTIFTVHSQFPAYNLQNRLASLFNVFMAKRVINVSETSYNVYPKFVRFIKGKCMSYIENGVDIERIASAKAKHKKKMNSVKQFVYVARMIPLKRHDYLIDVFHKVKGDYRLILIGAEDPEGNIRKKVFEYDMDSKVIIEGLVTRDEVFRKLLDSDVYVSSSAIEGLPVSVLEAMAIGLPVIISDIPPHVEIKRVCDEVIVISFDEEKWIKNIEAIIKLDNSTLKKKGEECRQAVIANFSLQKMHDRYYNEYKELLR